jgi:hypothetical protein
MTVKVLSNDGALYEGKSYAEVVRMMKLDSFVQHPSKQEYMAETARRCVIFSGKEIRYNGPKEFLQELQRIQAIQKVWVE